MQQKYEDIDWSDLRYESHEKNLRKIYVTLPFKHDIELKDYITGKISEKKLANEFKVRRSTLPNKLIFVTFLNLEPEEICNWIKDIMNNSTKNKNNMVDVIPKIEPDKFATEPLPYPSNDSSLEDIKMDDAEFELTVEQFYKKPSVTNDQRIQDSCNKWQEYVKNNVSKSCLRTTI